MTDTERELAELRATYSRTASAFGKLVTRIRSLSRHSPQWDDGWQEDVMRPDCDGDFVLVKDVDALLTGFKSDTP